MKKSCVISILMVLAITTTIAFALPAIADEAQDEERLVIGVMSLDPAIVAVRPAHVSEPSRPKFKTVWTPAVKIKKDISLKDQERIASAVARYVVEFQKGVPTADVMGGVIAFFEGEGWTPQVGQVFYRIEKGDVFVMTARNIVDEAGSVSCCDDDKLLGRVSGAKFIPVDK